jgi:hypothetical protein
MLSADFSHFLPARFNRDWRLLFPHFSQIKKHQHGFGNFAEATDRSYQRKIQKNSKQFCLFYGITQSIEMVNWNKLDGGKKSVD